MDRDPVIIAVYADMARRHGCSADDIVVTPHLRAEFLSNCRQSGGIDWDEEQTLRRLISLRKRSKLARVGELATAAV